MKLEQTVGVIMWADIGTTITSWLLSLSGIQGDSIFMKLLEPSSFSPILALIGIILLMMTSDEGKKACGTVMLGFAIIMGQNIGTCITAILASFGANRNSKRTAIIHLSFNVIGTTIYMLVFYSLNVMLHLTFLKEAADGVGIAVIHSTFNIAATIVLLPFSKKLVSLAYFILPAKEEENDKNSLYLKLLEERFLNKPGLAVVQNEEVYHHIENAVSELVNQALKLAIDYKKKGYSKTREQTDQIQNACGQLSSYLMRVCTNQLSTSESQSVNMLLQNIGDLERISSHALQIAGMAKEMNKQSQIFSKQAKAELSELAAAMEKSLQNGQGVSIQETEEQISRMKKEHMKRLQKEKCTVEVGIHYLEILTDCRSIVEHYKNMRYLSYY